MTAQRRLLVLALGIVAAIVTWLEMRNEPPPEPVVTPPPKRSLHGRVLDEGGVPIADASVQLFDHAAIWLDGADGGCALSLLACDTVTSGREVLKQLDAGTLRFPEPVARTQTDSDGKFVFGDLHDDQFVVANDAAERAEDGVTLRPQLEDIVLDDATLIVINPFTRQVSDYALAPRRSWATHVSAKASTVLTPSSASRRLRVGYAHSFDVQLTPQVDGEFELACEAARYRGRAKNGALHFDEIIAEYCMLSGEGGDFGAWRKTIYAGAMGLGVTLAPRARLIVKVQPEVGGTVSVFTPADGIGAIGQLPVIERSFKSGQPKELSLRTLARAQVFFRAPGYRQQSEELPLLHGLNEVSFTLTPEQEEKPPVMTKGDAVLMGSLQLQGKPMPGLTVTVGEERLTSNVAGQFRFEGLRPGPQLVVVRDENGRSFEVDAGAPDLELVIELPP